MPWYNFIKWRQAEDDRKRMLKAEFPQKVLPVQKLIFQCSIVVFFGLGTTLVAEAQQQRTFGRPLQRQAGPQRLQNVAAEAESAGGITGSERFLRDRRRPGEFVGSDQATTRFVGSGAVIESGRVQSAVESLPPAADLATQVNRRLAPAGPSQPYAPRLILAFEPLAAPNSRNQVEALDRIEQTRLEITQAIDRIGPHSLEVRLENRVAYLSGQVETEHQRALAVLITSMQPGVSQVTDQITISNGQR
ncbi:MAG: BON domain-containing protein [Pirellulaceae bacterium]|nr:BON domain-containing protein [Pirellulaceae bacterium]